MPLAWGSSDVQRGSGALSVHGQDLVQAVDRLGIDLHAGDPTLDVEGLIGGVGAAVGHGQTLGLGGAGDAGAEGDAVGHHPGVTEYISTKPANPLGKRGYNSAQSRVFFTNTGIQSPKI